MPTRTTRSTTSLNSLRRQSPISPLKNASGTAQAVRWVLNSIKAERRKPSGGSETRSKRNGASRPVGSKLTAKAQSSPSPRATGGEKGLGTQHRFASVESTDSPRVYAQASLLKPAPITAGPPFAPGALAGGVRGGGVEGATARRAVWLLSSLAVLPPTRGCWLFP